MGELALGDEGGYTGGQGIVTLIRELVDVRGGVHPRNVPQTLNSCPNSIKGKLEHPLTPWGDNAIVDEGLQSLSILPLTHHLELLPASTAVTSFLSIDVEGFQVIYSPGIEDFPVL